MNFCDRYWFWNLILVALDEQMWKSETKLCQLVYHAQNISTRVQQTANNNIWIVNIHSTSAVTALATYTYTWHVRG